MIPREEFKQILKSIIKVRPSILSSKSFDPRASVKGFTFIE